MVDEERSSEHENTSQRKNVNNNLNQSSSHIRKVQLLSVVLVFMISLGLGFLGGWIGSRYELNNNGSGIQKQIVSQQGDIIRNIAKQVGQSVVSINDTQMAETSISNSFFNFWCSANNCLYSLPLKSAMLPIFDSITEIACSVVAIFFSQFSKSFFPLK